MNKTLHLMILMILGSMVFGTTAVDAEMNTTLPEFGSGISTSASLAVDFDSLYQNVNKFYDVVEHDENHIVWKLVGVGDWAFVNSNGNLIVASNAEFNLNQKNNLYKELNEAISLIQSAGGRVSGYDKLVYYTNEDKKYRQLIYSFKNDFNLNLNVPNCTIEEAILTIGGSDLTISAFHQEIAGQHYYIDGKEVSGCDLKDIDGPIGGISCGSRSYEDVPRKWWGKCCEAMVSVTPVNIKDQIPYGLHKISASGIDNDHQMIIESVTTPSTKGMTLYDDTHSTLIEESSNSQNLDNLYTLIQRSE